MAIKKIIVAGPVLSGKQTLLHLLDGHPSIGVNLIHDHLLSPFLRMSLKPNISNLDFKHEKYNSTDKLLEFKSTKKKIKISLYTLLDALKNSNLHSLERYAFLKIIPNFYSVKEKNFHSFNFDFSKFQNEWKNKIFIENKNRNIKPEEIFDAILFSFFESWKDFEYKDLQNKQFAFKSPNHSDYSKFVLKEDFDAKVIYVSRDIVGLIKSRAMNESIRRPNYNINSIFSYMSNSTFIDKIKNELDIFKELQKNFPEKIKITSLEDLVLNTESEMKNLLRFLNLDENEICFYPSYNGKKITSVHTKKINDDEIEINQKLISYVKLRFYGYKFLNKKTHLHFSIHLKYMLFIIKKLLKNLFYPRNKNKLSKYIYEHNKH